jgi:hypothetical protein
VDHAVNDQRRQRQEGGALFETAPRAGCGSGVDCTNSGGMAKPAGTGEFEDLHQVGAVPGHIETLPTQPWAGLSRPP